MIIQNFEGGVPINPAQKITFAREQIISHAISLVHKDLLLTDPLELAFYLYHERFITLGDLLHSSIELFFQPQTLMYAYGGSVFLDWHTPLALVFDMEFRYWDIQLSFRLFMGRRENAEIKALSSFPEIEIMRLFFSESSENPDQNTDRLERAFREARCPND